MFIKAASLGGLEGGGNPQNPGAGLSSPGFSPPNLPQVVRDFAAKPPLSIQREFSSRVGT
jgi:hypothetical protein